MAEVVVPLAVGGPMFRPPEPINANHDVAGFTSTSDELNHWLKHRALASEARTSRTYVVTYGGRVVGYYAMAAGGIARAELPRAMRHNTPQQIPVMVLGRLATDQNFEGRGIGSGLLQEAIARTLAVSAEVGVRALLVHALDEHACGFYRKFGFVPSPIGERTLLLPVETASAALPTS